MILDTKKIPKNWKLSNNKIHPTYKSRKKVKPEHQLSDSDEGQMFLFPAESKEGTSEVKQTPSSESGVTEDVSSDLSRQTKKRKLRKKASQINWDEYSDKEIVENKEL